MAIDLSQSYAPAGQVSFLITNAGTVDHEMVVLKTDKPADSRSEERRVGKESRFGEAANDLKNIRETGDPAMKPGTSKMLTNDNAEGHYAIVCNLNGHYGSGMHQDVWVTPKGSTLFHAELGIRDHCVTGVEPCALPISAGQVSFLITNAGTVDHEMVVLKTDKPADS